MAVYTAYLPPDGDIERARFVSDARPLLALVLPSVFLLVNRLWFAFVVYVLIGVAIALGAFAMGEAAAVFLSLLPGLFLFVHGRELVADRLERMGWREAAVLCADNWREAELRFFGGHFAARAFPRARPSSPPLPGRPAAQKASFGMFPE